LSQAHGPYNKGDRITQEHKKYLAIYFQEVLYLMHALHAVNQATHVKDILLQLMKFSWAQAYKLEYSNVNGDAKFVNIEHSEADAATTTMYR